ASAQGGVSLTRRQRMDALADNVAAALSEAQRWWVPSIVVPVPDEPAETEPDGLRWEDSVSAIARAARKSLATVSRIIVLFPDSSVPTGVTSELTERQRYIEFDVRLKAAGHEVSQGQRRWLRCTLLPGAPPPPP